ncbi:hypothetical protein DAPPUDRAFT_334552 [Daphnia pulex]|uniref:Uncharacterized protein n=1 Tax=Daphnia pulex TaxID=6669 RepID=E9HVU6_DAPPU|nr:hypothetical protein DAPPUDRAFT_334552 [Daphnia pulex]|eukprot:EFX64134.1 hypothetical protein DAPPUDRAFT_334552 [Daphnia pulex]
MHLMCWQIALCFPTPLGDSIHPHKIHRVLTQDSSQSSNLPCHINDAEQAAVGVGTPRFVICQQGSDSLELGSASVGVGEDSQLDSQLINSPTLSDSSDNEPIDNPGPVIRRPLPAIAKRPPFPSTTSRPATTGVVSRPSTSANTNQRFSSGVSTPPSSANNRQQFVIPAVNRRPLLSAIAFTKCFVFLLVVEREVICEQLFKHNLTKY